MEMAKKWKHGFLLGKFYPFHLGHAYLIEEALKRCEHLVVLVACLPGDKEDFLEGRERFEAVKEHYQGYKGIEIRFHQDDDPQYPEEHPMFWNVWLKIILMNIDAKQTDIIFSSERYGITISRLLGIEHCMIDLDRKNVEISGTKVREDIFRNWNFLPHSTQKRLMRKVAILGPESSGKSTLAKQLSSHIGCKMLEEYGREFVEKGGICNDRGFQSIAIEHDRRLKRLVEENDKPLIICDTDWITTKVFYDMYKQKGDQTIGVPEGKLDFDLFSFSEYDVRILLHPGKIGAVQDGTRNFLSERLEHFKKIKEELDRRLIHYYVIDSGETAFEESVKVIESFLGCKIPEFS